MTDWIIKNRRVLNLSMLEREIGCPESTLRKVANSKMKLPEIWERKLLGYVTENLSVMTEKEAEQIHHLKKYKPHHKPQKKERI